MTHEFNDEALQRRASELGVRLIERECAMATAESCTGGWIAKTFTDVAGSSAWFSGGVVTYSNEAKQGLVGVRLTTLEAHGAVSEAVVLEMAEGALRALEADCAVSVSGVAGPGGGTAAKPVGTVWIAVAIRETASGRVGGQFSVDTRPATQADSSDLSCGHSPGFARSLARHYLFPGDRDDVRRSTVASAIELVMQALETE